MRMVRLPSGPLACVYSLVEEQDDREYSPDRSGTFRAHSGSLHADADTEDEAIAVLDEQVRRVSLPPEESFSLVPEEEPTRRIRDHSLWVKRVRKCEPSDSPAHASDADTPFEGVSLAPPSSFPAGRTQDR